MKWLSLCIVSRSLIALKLLLTKFIVYTPPNAATYGCHIYDETTGKSSHITLCNYFSILGKRVDELIAQHDVQACEGIFVANASA